MPRKKTNGAGAPATTTRRPRRKKAEPGSRGLSAAEVAGEPSAEARALSDAIVAQGFVPYVTTESWDVRGRGYHVEPGW